MSTTWSSGASTLAVACAASPTPDGDAVGTPSSPLGYDQAGRLTSIPGIVTEVLYDAAGRPTRQANADGNLTSGGGRTPQWNVYNMPTEIGGAQFFYDRLGERVKKTSAQGTSLYPMGDDYEITNGVVTKYITVAGLGVVAKRRGTDTFWMHTDRLGSIQAITDDDGAPVWRKTYRPYGEAITQSTTHQESRGWIDQRQDEETGLTYLHARYYDPTLGVFLSPDPLHPSTPGVGLNRYGYALGNPVAWSDRRGLEAENQVECWIGSDGEVHCGDSGTVFGSIPQDPWLPYPPEEPFFPDGQFPNQRENNPEGPVPNQTPQTPVPPPDGAPVEPNECPQGVTQCGEKPKEEEACSANDWTAVAGVNGTATPIFGLDAGIGVTVEFSGIRPTDVGTFTSTGGSHGWNISGNALLGALDGQIGDNLAGTSTTLNGTFGPWSASVINNSRGETVGFTAGAGPGLPPGGLSAAYTTIHVSTLKGFVETVKAVATVALQKMCPHP